MALQDWDVHMDTGTEKDCTREVVTVRAQSEAEAKRKAQESVHADGGRVVCFVHCAPKPHPIVRRVRFVRGVAQ